VSGSDLSVGSLVVETGSTLELNKGVLTVRGCVDLRGGDLILDTPSQSGEVEIPIAEVDSTCTSPGQFDTVSFSNDVNGCYEILNKRTHINKNLLVLTMNVNFMCPTQLSAAVPLSVSARVMLVAVFGYVLVL